MRNSQIFKKCFKPYYFTYCMNYDPIFCFCIRSCYNTLFLVFPFIKIPLTYIQRWTIFSQYYLNNLHEQMLYFFLMAFVFIDESFPGSSFKTVKNSQHCFIINLFKSSHILTINSYSTSNIPWSSNQILKFAYQSMIRSLLWQI